MLREAGEEYQMFWFFLHRLRLPEQYWLGRIRVKSTSITEALPPPPLFCLHFFGLPPGVKGSPRG